MAAPDASEKLIVKSLSVENFRSFAGLSTAEVQKKGKSLVLVVGANNCGKSNLLLAVLFWVKLFNFCSEPVWIWNSGSLSTDKTNLGQYHSAFAKEDIANSDSDGNCYVSLAFAHEDHFHDYKIACHAEKQSKFLITPTVTSSPSTCNWRPESVFRSLLLPSDLYFESPSMVWTSMEKYAADGRIDLVNLLKQLEICNEFYLRALEARLKVLFPGFVTFKVEVDELSTPPVFSHQHVIFERDNGDTPPTKTTYSRTVDSQGTGFKKVTFLLWMILMEHARHIQTCGPQLKPLAIFLLLDEPSEHLFPSLAESLPESIQLLQKELNKSFNFRTSLLSVHSSHSPTYYQSVEPFSTALSLRSQVFTTDEGKLDVLRPLLGQSRLSFWTPKLLLLVEGPTDDTFLKRVSPRVHSLHASGDIEFFCTRHLESPDAFLDRILADGRFQVVHVIDADHHSEKWHQNYNSTRRSSYKQTFRVFVWSVREIENFALETWAVEDPNHVRTWTPTYYQELVQHLSTQAQIDVAIARLNDTSPIVPVLQSVLANQKKAISDFEKLTRGLSKLTLFERTHDRLDEFANSRNQLLKASNKTAQAKAADLSALVMNAQSVHKFKDSITAAEMWKWVDAKTCFCTIDKWFDSPSFRMGTTLEADVSRLEEIINTALKC